MPLGHPFFSGSEVYYQTEHIRAYVVHTSVSLMPMYIHSHGVSSTYVLWVESSVRGPWGRVVGVDSLQRSARDDEGEESSSLPSLLLTVPTVPLIRIHDVPTIHIHGIQR